MNISRLPQVEALNTLLLSSKGLVLHFFDFPEFESHDFVCQELHQLERKLSSCDPEKVYTTIQKDLEDKYKFAAEYYEQLNETREFLINQDRLDKTKEQHYKNELHTNLDQVVNTLRKDFSMYIEEYYGLFDAVFVLHTNSFSRQELNELDTKINRYLDTAQHVYTEEYRKIEKIYHMLDEEGIRLNTILQIT